MTIEQAIEELKVEYLGDTDRIRKAKDMAIKSLEAWDEVKKEMLSQSIIKTHTESYESGFSDGLERAFDIIQDIIEEYLGGE